MGQLLGSIIASSLMFVTFVTIGLVFAKHKDVEEYDDYY